MGQTNINDPSVIRHDTPGDAEAAEMAKGLRQSFGSMQSNNNGIQTFPQQPTVAFMGGQGYSTNNNAIPPQQLAPVNAFLSRWQPGAPPPPMYYDQYGNAYVDNGIISGQQQPQAVGLGANPNIAMGNNAAGQYMSYNGANTAYARKPGANPIFDTPFVAANGVGGYYNNPGYGYGYYQQPVMNNDYIANQIYSNCATITIPPVRHGGEYLFDMHIEEEIDQMCYDQMCKEIREEREARQEGKVYVQNRYEFVRKVNDYISSKTEEARENREKFEVRISKLAHRFARDGYTDEKIEEMYSGKTIPNPFIRSIEDVQYEMDQIRFNNLVPYDDNVGFYRAVDAAISKEFHSVVPEHCDLKTFSEKMPILMSMYELQDEDRRRMRENTYTVGRPSKSTDSYRYCMMMHIANERAQQSGLPPDYSDINKYDYIDAMAKEFIDKNGNINLNVINRTVNKIFDEENTTFRAHISDDGTIELRSSLERYKELKAKGLIDEDDLNNPKVYTEPDFMNPPASIGKYSNCNEQKYAEDSKNFARFVNSVFVKDYDPKIHCTHRMQGSATAYDLTPAKTNKIVIDISGMG